MCINLIIDILCLELKSVFKMLETLYNNAFLQSSLAKYKWSDT